MWEHYRYTQDVNFLARAWPILRDALLFALDFLEESGGELVMGVTTSPENAYIAPGGKRVSFCRMAAMDAELIALLMQNCLEAAALLHATGREDVDIPAGFEEEVRAAAEKLAPPRIGRDGTILEWGFEAEEAEPGHRHHSHVIGAYPYNAITPANPTLYAAARKSIEKKIRNGGANTGWSRAWAGGLMARFGDGNAARDLISSMARSSGLPNLFSCCNLRSAPKLMEDAKPMQIDGNLGTVQAVIEMLLQSQDGEIVILPALPESWQAGSFEGLVARGNVVVDAWWQNCRLTHARLTSRADGDAVIRCGPGYCLVSDGGTMREPLHGPTRVRFKKGDVYSIERRTEELEC
jgi:alpha-L-fucosidase 2